MAVYCKAQSHYWQPQLNQTGLAISASNCSVDWSTTVRKVVVIAENTMSKSIKCLKWPPPALTHPERWRRHWCTEAAITAWSSLAHSVLMRYLRRRDQSCMFCTPCFAVFWTHFSQLDLNLANLEATLKAEWFLTFLFLRKRHLQWRHNYVITTWCRASIDGTFYNFQSHGLSGWFVPKIVKSCQNLSKLRPKYYRSFFLDTV